MASVSTRGSGRWLVRGVLAVAAAGAVVALAAEGSDLVGTWKLDPAASQDPGEAMRQAGGSPEGRRGPGMGGPGAGGPGAGGPGMGGPGMGGGGMRGGGPRGMHRGAGPGPGGPLALLGDRRMLSIVADGEGFAVADAEGQRRFLRPDGNKHKSTGANGTEVEVKSRLSDGALVVETEAGPMKLRETYSRRGERLVVQTQLDGPRGDVTWRQEYVASSAAAGTNTPQAAPGEPSGGPGTDGGTQDKARNENEEETR